MEKLFSGLKTCFANIRKNKQTFFLSVATITISIFILGLFLIIFINLNSLLVRWNSQVQLIVYLDDDITKSQKKYLKDYISASPKVESMNEITRDQAWEEFQRNMPDSSKALQELDFNPLPASYRIRFSVVENRILHIREFANKLQNQKGVESVDYGKDWINSFEKFMALSRAFLFALGFLLLFGLIFIISNTIRLSIFSRQDEIELMLLIGATPSFVKIPFILEGMLQGLVGSVLALIFVETGQFYLKNEFSSSIGFVDGNIAFIDKPILIALIGLSILIGLLASYLSTLQYLSFLNK